MAKIDIESEVERTPTGRLTWLQVTLKRRNKILKLLRRMLPMNVETEGGVKVSPGNCTIRVTSCRIRRRSQEKSKQNRRLTDEEEEDGEEGEQMTYGTCSCSLGLASMVEVASSSSSFGRAFPPPSSSIVPPARLPSSMWK